MEQSWFYLVTIVIECFGGKALTAIISAAIQSAHDKNNKQLIESLKIISSTIDEITKVLLQIYEKRDSCVDGCDENGNPIIASMVVEVLYSHESSNENLSNNYNNTSKKRQSIQQQQHQQPYIYKIHQKIPGNHQIFLEDLTKAAIIHDYITSCIECDDNMEINGKLDTRNKSSKVKLDSNNKDVTNGAVTSGSIINGTIYNVRDTDGIDLMPFLKQMREETKSKEIKNLKDHLISNKKKSLELFF
ncbi:17504_t:CDS:2 [Entrophospora sp. SA101]|nr:13855_t:CDS:2 [Entrophospora sp. SA101]CAJ0752516.1 17504_t:CDS:2 [Entrophospora sp. SA101]